MNYYADEEAAYHQLPEAVSPLHPSPTKAKQKLQQCEKRTRAWQRHKDKDSQAEQLKELQKLNSRQTHDEVSSRQRAVAAVAKDDININENCNDNEDNITPPTAAEEAETTDKLHWLEKVYALNRQLQQQEEMMLKLHAKIKKYQVW